MVSKILKAIREAEKSEACCAGLTTGVLLATVQSTYETFLNALDYAETNKLVTKSGDMVFLTNKGRKLEC